MYAPVTTRPQLTPDKDKGIPQKSQSRLSVLYFIGSFAAAFGLTWLLKEPAFTDSQVYTLFLLFFAIGLWLTEAIPPFAVGLFIMAYLVFTLGNPHFNSAPEKIDRYVNTFSSSIIWLLLGGFFLAFAMTKTLLDRRLLKFTLTIAGTNPKRLLVALMFTTMTASMLMSNTATTAMIMAALMPLLNHLGKSGTSKALLLGVAFAASTGGMGTIIGSPSNAIAAAMLEHHAIKIDFLRWMLYGFPLAIVLTATGCFVFLKFFMRNPATLSLSFLKEETNQDTDATPGERKIVVGVIIVTITLWLTGSIHGISTAAVSAIPLVVLTLTGVLTGPDIRKLPWEALFLVAGGLSLGVALESTGLLKHYANYVKTMQTSSLVLVFLITYATMVVSNVMSNSAASTILIPLGISLLPGLEKQVAVAVALASSSAFMLPISTPWNTIVYNTGLLEQKDFRIGGFLLGLLGPLLAVLWVMFL